MLLLANYSHLHHLETIYVAAHEGEMCMLLMLLFCILLGPGAYNKTGLGQESMKKAYIESTRRGVFGTTSARINAMVKKDDYYLPGPAHYTVKEAGKIAEPKRAPPMGVFSSLTNRVHEDVEAKVI